MVDVPGVIAGFIRPGDEKVVSGGVLEIVGRMEVRGIDVFRDPSPRGYCPGTPVYEVLVLRGAQTVTDSFTNTPSQLVIIGVDLLWI